MRLKSALSKRLGEDCPIRARIDLGFSTALPTGTALVIKMQYLAGTRESARYTENDPNWYATMHTTKHEGVKVEMA
ncbi:MAG: hypothetical protein AAB658_00785, partial [Chloroflexota bacterium]